MAISPHGAVRYDCDHFSVHVGPSDLRHLHFGVQYAYWLLSAAVGASQVPVVIEVSMPDSYSRAIVRYASGALDFTDSAGTLWTVSEIARLDYSEKLMAMLPHPERRQGWLLFESNLGERRRLTPVPAEWRSLPIAELQQCLQNALPASAGEQRRRTDELR